MKPTFNIGDEVYVAGTKTETDVTQVICPDCRGAKKLKVTLGDNTEVFIDCSFCEQGWMGSQGFNRLSRIEPEVKAVRIDRITIEQDNPVAQKVTYWAHHFGWDGDRVFKDPDTALLVAKSLAYNARAEAEKRLEQKDKPARTWAWHVNYHRREIREAEKKIEYHSKKLGIARQHVKEEKA